VTARRLARNWGNEALAVGDPLDRLVAAIWLQVALDLGHPGPRADEARAWLDSPNFRWLAGLSLPDADPDALRARLLREFARPRPDLTRRGYPP
jgi:hypothetical protein